GNTWSLCLNQDNYYPLGMFFLTTEIGFVSMMALDGSSGFFYKTYDGGLNWTVCQYPDHFPQKMFFVTPETGYTIFYNYLGAGKTIDGGITWIPIELPTCRPLNNLCFLSADTGYLTGELGTILYTANGGFPVGVSEPADKYKSPLMNYPNPFTGSTEIVYQLENRSDVNLRISDLSGRERRSILLKGNPPGEYKIPFTAGDLPPGIYFYQVRTDHSCKTGKMIVVH
ncbi:MAG: T9SS type A sorting domain-containing protein, partial [Bacteroidota bacterium]